MIDPWTPCFYQKFISGLPLESQEVTLKKLQELREQDRLTYTDSRDRLKSKYIQTYSRYVDYVLVSVTRYC